MTYICLGLTERNSVIPIGMGENKDYLEEKVAKHPLKDKHIVEMTQEGFDDVEAWLSEKGFTENQIQSMVLSFVLHGIVAAKIRGVI